MVSEHGPAPTRQLPPIVETAVTSMALVIAGGIYLAAYLPRQAPLPVPIVLISLAGVVLLAAVVMLTRLRDFAWDRFRQVSGWALVAYVVIAGMLEYVLLVDQTRGALLLLLTITLTIFALDIPIVLGFSVARHQEVGTRPSS
ncbi:MAG TPA: hypothetical protein VMW80_10345 [Candidatus Dormibacteraeota bacterium]|nr:hypothetical protein [Candidatus Dormibacteraeota bacterium]